MRTARRFVVRGRVQGVGFRFFAQEAAMREGLTGTVRNQDDGSVEAVAEGEAASVARFEAALHRGPSHARVESVEVEPLPPGGSHLGFVIG